MTITKNPNGSITLSAVVGKGYNAYLHSTTYYFTTIKNAKADFREELTKLNQ
jgi:hypothetical protein